MSPQFTWKLHRKTHIECKNLYVGDLKQKVATVYADFVTRRGTYVVNFFVPHDAVIEKQRTVGFDNEDYAKHFAEGVITNFLLDANSNTRTGVE